MRDLDAMRIERMETSMDKDPRHWAAVDPHRPAVLLDQATLTYEQLERDANRIAQLLRDRGIRRGDHVGAILGNDPLIFAIAWACYRSGAYFTPIPSTSSPRDAAYIVANSTARVVIADPRLATAAGITALVDTGPVWFGVGTPAPGFEDLASAMAGASDEPVSDERPGALMMYTSGTTGAPKGVWRPLPETVDGPAPFARDLLAMFDIRAGDRYLSTAPLYHAAALRFGLAFTAAGGTVRVMKRFDADEALGLLENEAITHSQWVPTMFQRMLALAEDRRAAFRAPHHRVALHSAAPCPVPVKRRMIDWWGPILEEYYSGTEGVGLTALTSREWLDKPGSVGRARKGSVHILDEQWREAPAGATGKVYFSGIAPFSYFNDAEKTKARMSPQGWQTFGDLGHLDADGYLFLTDRQDDMIISGGVNIYPQELEAALMELTELQDAAVVGMPDTDFGEVPIAFVVAGSPAADHAQLHSVIEAWCRDRLGRVKRPKHILFVDALPRSPQGKVLRRELRKLAEPAPMAATDGNR